MVVNNVICKISFRYYVLSRFTNNFYNKSDMRVIITNHSMSFYLFPGLFLFEQGTGNSAAPVPHFLPYRIPRGGLYYKYNTIILNTTH